MARINLLLGLTTWMPVYTVGLVNKVPYFAMQYIEGGSLSGLIAEVRVLAGQSAGQAADPSSGDSPSALALGLLSGGSRPHPATATATATTRRRRNRS